MKVKIIYLIVMLFLPILAKSQKPDRAISSVNLDIANHSVSTSGDLTLHLKIKSKWQHAIAIPKSFTWGLFGVKPSVDFILIEIQKKKNGKYEEIRHHGTLDNVPSQIDSLYFGDSVIDNKFSIADFYHFNEGSYRVRVLCRFTLFNPRIQDVFSTWVYFGCLNDVKSQYGRKD